MPVKTQAEQDRSALKKKFTRCVLNAGEWHVEWELRDGDRVVETHVLGIDAASLAENPAQYEQEYPDACEAIRNAE